VVGLFVCLVELLVRDAAGRGATAVAVHPECHRDQGAGAGQRDLDIFAFAGRARPAEPRRARTARTDGCAAAIKDGDDPAVVAKVIVAAATDPKPKLRYTAGPLAGRASTLRRFVPARAFDSQIRKLNQLAD
jgi:hypothetical protein